MQVSVQNRKSVRLGQFLSPKILVIPFLRWITALSHLSVALFWLGGEEFSHPQIFQSSPHQKSSNGLHPNNLRAESPEPGGTGLLLGTRFSPLAGWIFPSSTLACFYICSLCFSLSSRAMVVWLHLKYRSDDCRIDFTDKILISEHDRMPVCLITKNSSHVSNLQIGHFPVPLPWAFFPLSFSKITVVAGIETWVLNSLISQNWQIVFKWKSSVWIAVVKQTSLSIEFPEVFNEWF